MITHRYSLGLVVEDRSNPLGDTVDRDAGVERPAFVSEEVWQVVQLAAEQNKVDVRDYVEKALLDEAIILEQVRIGRRWLVEDKGGDLGEVEFG